MFRNLEAELKRKNISRADIAKLLGVSESTVSKKFTKKGKLKLVEAQIIRNECFPDLSISYLFDC